MASLDETAGSANAGGAQQAAWPDDPVLAEVLATVAAAECCWFSSVRPDGRAHLAPIWHVVHDRHIYVVTQRQSVRARNIRTNPAVSLALPDALNPIIVEGVAAPALAAAAVLQPLFLQKYNWDISTDADYNDILAVTPHKVMTWGSHGEHRWTLSG